MTTEKEHDELHRLARAFGVMPEYTDIRGRRRDASPEGLLAVLRCLGAEVEHGVSGALQARRRDVGRRTVDSVIVSWDGGPARLLLRHPLGNPPAAGRFSLLFEDGSTRAWEADLTALPLIEELDGGSELYAVRLAFLPTPLPLGYHRLRVQVPGLDDAEALVIVAPEQAPRRSAAKRWGVFLPLYALRSEAGMAGPDFTALAGLARWTGSLGGSFVGTLPLLAAYLDNPLEVSPYVPVSRLFWNEFYLDVSRAADGCGQPAVALTKGAGRAPNPGADELDYRSLMAFKRRVLERAAGSFFDSGDAPSRLAAFLRDNPYAESYAAFRACVEKHGANWRAWAPEWREGRLPQHAYDAQTARYHLYVQWETDRQLADVRTFADAAGCGLYLDLPVGVHPDGFDTWRFPGLFVSGVSQGAPPDDFFTLGQDWGFPPFHPDRVREDGYAYFRQYIRRHLLRASLLRIDHVMAFQRVFCVPHGARATEGVYVQHRPEEFWAILCLEAARAGSEIIGENLGTVPPEVNAALTLHAVRGMYVGQFRVTPGSPGKVQVPPTNVAAGLNTHDVPTFAAFWRGDDIGLRVRLGYLSPGGEQEERAARRRVQEALVERLHRDGFLPTPVFEEAAVLVAWQSFLAASAAEIMVVNLEDLWLEPRPQNVPGTGPELPNWRRPARHTLETFTMLDEVLDILRQIDALRRKEPIHAP